MSRFARAPRKGALSGAVLTCLALSACNAAQALDPGSLLGQDHIVGPPGDLPPDPPPLLEPRPGPVPIGPSCHSDDPTRLCLALKYAASVDPTGEPVTSESEAVADVHGINGIWNQCGVSFQIDEYLAVHPEDYRLAFEPSESGELDGVRRALGDDSTLLVVTTGTWDRSGTLGDSTANAWTNLPGSPPYGAVLEQPVATYANIIAHELGHYLNLLHVSDSSDLMNPVIFSSSTHLRSSQCATARSSAAYYWAKMYR